MGCFIAFVFNYDVLPERSVFNTREYMNTQKDGRKYKENIEHHGKILYLKLKGFLKSIYLPSLSQPPWIAAI